MRCQDFLHDAARLLAAAGADAPRLAAQVLLGHVLGMDRGALISHGQCELAPEAHTQAQMLIRRHAAGEPVAYLLGHKEFFSREFIVSPATLIPRPETEELCEAVLTALPDTPLRFADLGCGSGCIGTTLLAERPTWRGALLDISAPALAITQENLRRLQLTARAHLLQASMEALPFATGCLQLVVSNPPYISGPEYADLDKSVREYEPRTALTSDASGLRLLRALAHTAARTLCKGGLFFAEHGAAQGECVRELFSNTGYWTNISIQKDLAGHDRWIRCSRA